MSHPYYRGQQFCLWQELLISGHRIEVVKAINIIVGQIVKNPENTHNRLIAIAKSVIGSPDISIM